MAAYPARLIAIVIVLWCGAAEAVQQVRSLYGRRSSACETVAGALAARRGSARDCPVIRSTSRRETEGCTSASDRMRTSGARRSRPSNRSTLCSTGVGGGPRSSGASSCETGGSVPCATIVRYFTQSERGGGEVLVVMRVTDSEVCHVAYVDALANADAMVLARKLADTVARSKECPAEPAGAGRAGRSPM